MSRVTLRTPYGRITTFSGIRHVLFGRNPYPCVPMKEALMYAKATYRAVTAAWVLGLATLMGAPSALAAPVRLKLTIDKDTLGAGEHARLRVAFLDRDYQP